MTTVVRTFEEAKLAYFSEERLALDLETGGFSPYKAPIHVISLYGENADVISILHYPKGVPVPQEVLDWLAGFKQLVTHNGTMFDMLFLAQAGMDWAKPALFDTMVGELSVLATSRKDIKVNLADTIKRRLGREVDKDIDHDGWGAPELSENHLAYCTGDIKHILKLMDRQLKDAKKIGPGVLRCIDFEMALTKPVIRMELRGIPVDLEAVRQYFVDRLPRQEATIKYLTEALGPILLTSPVQLKKALGEKFGLKMFPDTGAERLMNYLPAGGELAEVCQGLLDFRNFNQRNNMFGEKWVREFVFTGEDGIPRVHGKFWQIGTNTGRFSSSQPNLQQIPRDMRYCYGNAPGWLIGKADFAAIEVRVAAAMANDQVMIEAFNRGEDIHTVVASAGFGKPYEAVTKEERKIAKAMSFTLLFGGGAETFRSYAAARGSKITSEIAEAAVEAFFDRFRGIAHMKEVAQAQADSGRPRVLVYPTGLRRLVQGYDLRATVILNNWIQGCAACGMKYAIAELEARGFSKYLSAVVHDEIVWVCRAEEMEEIRTNVEQSMILGMQKALKGCPAISIGVESTFGKNWVGDEGNERLVESGV